MSWRKPLLILVIAITIFQTLVAITTDIKYLWLIPAHLLSTIALWLGYLYRYSPTMRVQVIRFLAFFTKSRASMEITARLSISGELSAKDVVSTIRVRYQGSQVRDFRSDILTNVEMPGWQARFSFSSPAAAELIFDDDDTRSPGYLMFTVPDRTDAIASSIELLQSEILPLFEVLTKELPLTIDVIQLVIRFRKLPNPYLAAYLQNIDLDKVVSLKCVLDEKQPGSQAQIGRESITLRAMTINDLGILARKHLSLQWVTR